MRGAPNPTDTPAVAVSQAGLALLAMNGEGLESILTGGHHNSLGRTVEAVEIVLGNHARLEELYRCYSSADEVVRLRTSSAFKRVCLAKPEWLVPYVDRFLSELATIEQASTQWTLAILFDLLRPEMSDSQFVAAVELLKHNLATWDDWIVLNYTMQTLTGWAESDPSLAEWLRPHLKELTGDRRKSVAARATKMMAQLG